MTLTHPPQPQHTVFSPGATGTTEAHWLMAAPAGLRVEAAWRYLEAALLAFEAAHGLRPSDRAFGRVFFSDIANQWPVLQRGFPAFFGPGVPGHISLVQQPPLPGSRLAVWVYWVQGAGTLRHSETHSRYASPAVRHYWSANRYSHHPDPRTATAERFAQYAQQLEALGGTLLDNALRTWLFVPHIDADYAGIVEGRKAIFAENGLHPGTHYISSTGIEGKGVHPHLPLMMDTYSVIGLDPRQVQHLKAPSHLCPTHRYGVTFERGTAITYGDRQHVFISGTASIDPSGQICHPHDPVRQVERMVENVEALLHEAGGALPDLVQALVYLRDPCDYPAVQAAIARLLPNVPLLYLHAPVCRPGWLVEIEGIAVRAVEGEWRGF